MVEIKEKTALVSTSPRAGHLDATDPVGMTCLPAVLFAVVSPSTQHRPGIQLIAPSMISKWKDKHRKSVVTVVPAKSITGVLVRKRAVKQ